MGCSETLQKREYNIGHLRLTHLKKLKPLQGYWLTRIVLTRILMKSLFFYIPSDNDSFIYCLRRSSYVLRYIKYLYLETAYSFQEAVSMLPGLVFDLNFGHFDELIK